MQSVPTNTAPEAERPRPHHEESDQHVILHGMTWKDYEILLAVRGDRAGVRMYYLNGAIELMSPSRSHEGIKTTIARLLEAYCDERGIELSGYGAWTLRNAPRERGAEPDECYIVGDTNKEIPDLAIEVAWTHGGLDKLEIYRGLGVAEVWMWDREEGLRIFALAGERYELRARSTFLPELDPAWLGGFLDQPTQSQAVRALRAALR
ncbi:Uma2 family endonuclease [Sorangium sp. So ce1389]|uniref:Uma2 family endonuclease n=1 Tax=Sorangium sp. So ce1389 TaxID=3133336 RepID=UPI003F62E61C